MNEKISILIVNYNSAKFIDISLYALKKLTKNKYKVFILDNNSTIEDYHELKKICFNQKNVFLERSETKLKGSIAHGTGLNYLMKKIDTPYFSILDADAIWLKKNWDEILINQITNKIKVIGTQAPKNKPQDFPLMFAILFETKAFKSLNINFKPKDITKHLDTGFELREKFLKAGFYGKQIELKSTRNYKKGPFRNVCVCEYYINKNYTTVFASHFARGSTLGANKYTSKQNKNKKYIYSIPILGKIFLKNKGIKERDEWINKCKELIDKQCEDKKTRFKIVNCDYCNSTNFTKLFSAKDNYNKLPGIFTVVKCNKCKLVYTNPRPIKKNMKHYYPEHTGYYLPQKPKEKKNFKNKIRHVFLREYYDYFSKEKRNIFAKLILFPWYLYSYKNKKISGIPKFQEKGSLLDIGCSYGSFLFSMKKLGWNVTGLEMDKKMADWGTKNFTINIINTNIDSFYTTKKFDVITMRMTLEHIYSPKKALSKVKNMLKPEGQLIISVPDFNGIESKIYKQFFYSLHLPNHLTHFTPKTIKRYLNDLNFKNIKIYHQKRDADLIVSLKYMQINGRKTKFLIALATNKIVRKSIIKLFMNLLSCLGKTSRMIIYAIK